MMTKTVHPPGGIERDFVEADECGIHAGHAPGEPRLTSMIVSLSIDGTSLARLFSRKADAEDFLRRFESTMNDVWPMN